jgi:signal peptidase I
LDPDGRLERILSGRAYRQQQMDSETQRSGEHRGARGLRLGLLVVAGFLLFNLGARVMFWQVERFALKPYRIPSSAMEPTLHCPRPAAGCEADTADRILVSRLVPFWTPSRGDIVAFRTPPMARERCGTGGTFVKRIVGLPGEQVSIHLRRGTAWISIDGGQLDEPYIENDRRDTGPKMTFRVPEGEYFVMGDNRNQSCDSRAFGSVPRDNLVGPLVAVYWPFDRMGLQ